MKQTLGSKGANLHMMSADSWVYDDHSGQLFDGRFKAVIGHMITKGFTINEVELAVNAIIHNNHDSANFGMFKGFIFSYNRKGKVSHGN